MINNKIFIKQFIVVLFMLFLFSSINSVEATSDAKWNLYFQNIEITPGSVPAIVEPKIIGESNTGITYDIRLEVPGDFYEFTVDVVNAGTLDAMVNDVNGIELTSSQKRYLDYEFNYMDGTPVKQYDKLKAGTTVKLKVRIEFKRDITAEDLPIENSKFTLSINTYYIQADDRATDKEKNEDETNDGDKNKNNENTTNASDGINNVRTGDIIMLWVILSIVSLFGIIIMIKPPKSNENKE